MNLSDIKNILEKNQKLIAWGYIVVLLCLQWLPLNGLGRHLDRMVFGIRLDHILHAAIFLPLAATISILLVRKASWSLLISLVLACLIERVQYSLHYRSFDKTDIVANIFGVTVGWLIYLVVKCKLNNK